MKKIGISCEHYKVEKFKQELTDNGFTDFKVTSGLKLCVITINAPEASISEIQNICQGVVDYFHRIKNAN